MKERIKGAFTKKKIFHFLKMALFVVALSLILLSLLGTVAHATGLVDDTINAENLYSKYPLSNYQLDFYVDNSWSWLPWNWLDGIGKSVQYGLYCRRGCLGWRTRRRAPCRNSLCPSTER